MAANQPPQAPRLERLFELLQAVTESLVAESSDWKWPKKNLVAGVIDGSASDLVPGRQEQTGELWAFIDPLQDAIQDQFK